MCTCACAHVHMCMCMCMCMCTCACAHVHVHMCMCTCAHVHVHVHMCMCMCMCTCAAMCAWYRCVPALQQFNSLKEHIKLRWKEDELIYQLKTEIDIAPFGDKVKQWIWKEHNQINKTIQECQTCRKKEAGISSLRHHMEWEDCDQLCLQLSIRYTYWIEISTKLWS